MWTTSCITSDNNAADGVTPISCDTQAGDQNIYGGSTGAPAWENIGGIASIRGINTIAHTDASGVTGNFLMQMTTQDVNNVATWVASERRVGDGWLIVRAMSSLPSGWREWGRAGGRAPPSLSGGCTRGDIACRRHFRVGVHEGPLVLVHGIHHTIWFGGL